MMLALVGSVIKSIRSRYLVVDVIHGLETYTIISTTMNLGIGIYSSALTRGSGAYELLDKTKNSIHHVLQRFVNKYHTRKLTHDEKKA